jgi:hypothetical protein
VPLAREATPVATLAPSSKAMRAQRWFAANVVATATRMTMPSRGGNVADMGADVITPDGKRTLVESRH